MEISLIAIGAPLASASAKDPSGSGNPKVAHLVAYTAVARQLCEELGYRSLATGESMSTADFMVRSWSLESRWWLVLSRKDPFGFQRVAAELARRLGRIIEVVELEIDADGVTLLRESRMSTEGELEPGDDESWEDDPVTTRKEAERRLRACLDWDDDDPHLERWDHGYVKDESLEE